MIQNEEDLELSINPALSGTALREQLVTIYNNYVYFNSQHSIYDGEKRSLENTFEEVKDRARAIRAKEAEEKNLKAKIQEAYIRDFWMIDVEVYQDGAMNVVTPGKVRELLNRALKKESYYRRKCMCAQSALDLGRTMLSWDKQELNHIGGM